MSQNVNESEHKGLSTRFVVGLIFAALSVAPVMIWLTTGFRWWAAGGDDGNAGAAATVLHILSFALGFMLVATSEEGDGIF